MTSREMIGTAKECEPDSQLKDVQTLQEVAHSYSLLFIVHTISLADTYQDW